MNIYPSAIEEVYTTLEEIIINHLLEAEKDTPIIVKFSEGIKFESKVIPEHYHNHPITTYTLVPEKLKFNCRITTGFQKKRQTEYNKSREALQAYFTEREKYAEQYKRQQKNK